MSDKTPKWYRALKGTLPGVIPNIGIHDHSQPIQARSPEHEKAILGTGLYEEAPAPKGQDEPEPETAAPTLADAAAAAEATPTPKGGKK